MFQLKIKEKLKSLGIKSGDKVIVTSDVLKFLIFLKNLSIRYTLNNFIDDLINVVGRKGNIIFPTFNWDFCKGKDFCRERSKSMTGALSNIALRRKDFKRSKNPIYSFAVWGKNKNKICSLSHKSCFSLKSPFGYLIKNNAKNLCIGMNFRDAFTFVHVVEQKIGVNYRYFKTYNRNIIEKNKKKKMSYNMYVRDLSLNLETKINKKLEKILKKNKKMKSKKFFGINFSLVNVKNAFNIMSKDLKNNGNIIFTKKIKI